MLAIAFSTVLVLQADPPAPTPMPAEGVDTVNIAGPCPTKSLYILLKLWGREPDYQKIRERLGSPGPEGVSISDLCGAAADFGMPLRAVYLNKGDLDTLYGPFIAYMKPCKGSGMGHFAVARLVCDGSKLQLLDPPNPAILTDRSDPFRDGAWCRIALVPKDPALAASWVVPILIGSGGMCISVWILRFPKSTSTATTANTLNVEPQGK